MKIRPDQIYSAILSLLLGLGFAGCGGGGEIQVYTVAPLPPRVKAPGHWREVPRKKIAEDVTQSLLKAGLSVSDPSFSRMRMDMTDSIKQRFAIVHAGADSNATATLTVLPFDAKSSDALSNSRLRNVNRWRRKVGLPGLEDAALKDALEMVPGLPEEARLLDARGESNRILGVLVPFNRSLWVYTLTGAPEAVGRERDAFLKLLPDWR